jgi:hypothetical protein
LASLTKLTTLATAEPDPYVLGEAEVDVLAENLKAITPKGVGINLIFNGGAPLLWRTSLLELNVFEQ